MYVNSSTEELAEIGEKILRHASDPSQSTHAPNSVVFDIDATLLFNDARDTPCLSRRNLPITRLYDVALELQVPIFLVTARANTTEGRAFTYDQLKCLGMDQFTGMYMRPPITGTSVKNISIYKKECRKLITRLTGRRITLNIGDQWSDLFVCDNSARLQQLNSVYGNVNVLFESPSYAFSDWSFKLQEEEQ